jgi:hypothetical protein
MKTQLPPETKKQFDHIIEKLLAILEAAREHTSARSEFMDYDGSMGGQVLESSPSIEHPQHEITELYMKMFGQAKKEGLDLREIETEFERKKAGGPWAHKTRWITKEEFKAFTEKIAPIVEEIRVALRKVAAATAPDWYRASFNTSPTKTRVLVLHGDKVKKNSEPTPELMQLAKRIAEVAASQGLVSSSASFGVDDEMDDAEGDIDSAVGATRAWPDVS